ncbi:MAG: glycosyltransferase family 4 protein [Cyanobacteria bacterium P01_A01_bin.83]
MNSEIRIAWLLPVAWYYWQPSLSEFSKLFPHTQIFTGKWPGFAKGYEDSLQVKQVGKTQFVKLAAGLSKSYYGRGFSYMSPKIIVELLKYRPKVIFADSFRVWTIIALLLKPWLRWKVIMTYEGSSPGVDHLDSSLRLLLRRIMTWSADALMTNSQAGKRYLSDILQAPVDKIFVHPYQVPSAKSLQNVSGNKPQQLELTKPVFLFVGHIIPRKGLRYLLEACLILQQQGAEYTLLIVGDGTEQDELKAFCHQHSLENVKWVGRVDYQEIGNYFAQADVFVFPTKEDTWGVSVIEAMLFNKPVLCSTGAGTSELIIDGANGYVFDSQNPDQLAQLMGKIIEQPSLIESMSLHSAKIVQQYTPEIASQTLVEALEFSIKEKV